MRGRGGKGGYCCKHLDGIKEEYRASSSSKLTPLVQLLMTTKDTDVKIRATRLQEGRRIKRAQHSTRLCEWAPACASRHKVVQGSAGVQAQHHADFEGGREQRASGKQRQRLAAGGEVSEDDDGEAELVTVA